MMVQGLYGNRRIVVIPTYNENENIAQMIEAILAVPGGFHIVVVDDNSPDSTADLSAHTSPAPSLKRGGGEFRHQQS